MQLALSESEAQKLFAGLSGSKDANLREAGQAGITSIQDQPVSILVASMNAPTAEERKQAVAKLIHDYKNSSTAVSMALDTFQPRQVATVSPSGVINALYFLANTDEAAWTEATMNDGLAVVARLEANSPGPQTAQAVSQLKQRLEKVKGVRH